MENLNQKGIYAMAAEHVNKIQFNLEQTDIIKTLLKYRFFNPWKEYQKNNLDINYDKHLNSESSLEIFITANCNQSCEYCYLIKNKSQLYPQCFDNKELILKNLQILMDWIIENNFYIPTIEIFSGEIWHLDYGLEVLNILYQSVLNGLQTDIILIPSNCSFILDTIQTQKIQQYINKFQKINTRLCFSISIDGKIIDNFRPLNKTQVKDDLYYENIFLFAHHNNFYFHPMISSSNVNKWVDNYLWFEEMCAKYDCDIENLMTLEVRNNDWNEKNIQEYINFLDFLLKRKVKSFSKIEDFFDYIFCLDNFSDSAKGYIPYAITFADSFPGCTVCNHMTVRLGDLAICPCHRTAYNKFLYGHFIVENNKIIDIKGNNPEIASRILLADNTLASFGCDVCQYRQICMKGCFGAQYETEKDLFFPIESVCNFFKEKYSYLTKTYIQLGIIDYLEKISPYSMNYNYAQKLLKYFKENKDVGKN